MRRLRLERLEDRVLLSNLGVGPAEPPPRSAFPAQQGPRSPGGDRGGPQALPPPASIAPTDGAAAEDTATSPTPTREAIPETQGTVSRPVASAPPFGVRSPLDAPEDSALPRAPAVPTLTSDLLFAAWGGRPALFTPPEAVLVFGGKARPHPVPDEPAGPESPRQDTPRASASDAAPNALALGNPHGAGLVGEGLPLDLAGLEAGVRRFLEGVADGRPFAAPEDGGGVACWLVATAAGLAAAEFARRRWLKRHEGPVDQFRGWLPG